MEKKERIYVFDNVKVWLMLMVVLGHTVIPHYGSSNIGIAYLWFFRGIYTMPLFFFISGFFTKPGGGSNLHKLIRSVLMPFLVFDIAYLFYEPIFNTSFTMDWTSPGFAMWFLLVLFIYRMIFPFLIKIRYILAISIIVALVVGFVPFIGKEFGLSRMFCFLPFYLLGYYVKNDKKFELVRKKILQPLNLKDWIVLFCLIFIWAAILYIKPGLAYYTTFTQGYDGNWFFLLVRISLYVSAFAFGYYVLKMFPNRKTFYTKYGGRTMGVYLFHGFIVLPIAYKLFEPVGADDYFHMAVKICLPVLLSLLLFSKPVDYIVKKLF